MYGKRAILERRMKMELMMLDGVFRGERLRKMRENRNLYQQEVADYLGITSATLSRFETGARQPDASMLVKMANYFNCSVDYLLGRVEDPNMSHDEYIEKIKKAHHLGGDMFSPEKLEKLSQERFEALLKFARDQYRLNEIDDQDKE